MNFSYPPIFLENLEDVCSRVAEQQISDEERETNRHIPPPGRERRRDFGVPMSMASLTAPHTLPRLLKRETYKRRFHSITFNGAFISFIRCFQKHRLLSILSSIHPCRMDLWEIILFFWAPISRHIGYFKDLNINVETLKRKTKKLKRKHDEIQAEVDNAIPVGKRQKALVENWLTEIRYTENQVDSIRLELALRRICTDHSSRYTLGKRVVEKLEDIKKLNKKLKVKGIFDKVAESSRHPRVLEKQTSLPRGQQSTSDRTLEEIWQCLHEEENGIIGICGMGGIGKTTLMKEINNRCTKTRDFDVVIWITVSKDLNLGLIQEEIGNRLGMIFDGNEDKGDKLFTRLKNLRYLIILDDLWESFSLVQVGIPKPDKQNRCKIAITSRSVTACNAMGADMSIKVRALTTEEAWNLFCERCGNVVLLSEIQPVAEKVAAECSGLPLAIKTVGGAMRGKDKKEVWRNALRALEGASPEVPGNIFLNNTMRTSLIFYFGRDPCTFVWYVEKLPLFSSSIHEIKGEIEGNREWWEGLE
ncbi:probable disease resistance protein At1g52660 [Magnolia sinica]|uniref:probable disease resistance protein At1g52660 n=1 Tax=Magnolia sinica TaxID=86752 RepID=UPI0026595C93|nr:probable disease resistance protein At1g52660 [Magnolia sinica]